LFFSVTGRQQQGQYLGRVIFKGCVTMKYSLLLS
jgi:hypothetical protein